MIYSLMLSLCKTLGYRLPINDIPHLLEIISTHILVLQVVGMLPDINDQQRYETLQDVLIARGCNLNTLSSLIVAEPTPSRALMISATSKPGKLLRSAILSLLFVF